ncbi:MAG: queuosine precursor transporter [Alphaproteobacteria bacterium]|nr:queuosine precursor transporter [Alphaproteobacteria bacterium]
MLNSSLSINPELLSISTLFLCFIAILSTTKFFGKSGLYVYSTIATITSNIQVLKLTQYSLYSTPVALGTVLFSTTFAVDNILTEYYGTASAKKGLYISFFGYLFFVIIMQITILHPPVLQTNCVNFHNELQKLFLPTPYLFISSLIAFFIGQHSDIFIYSILKKFFNGKYLIGRAMFSMAVSAFIDNFVFSFLAWIIFSENPISISDLWKTYICVTYIIRLLVSAFCVPIVKLAGNFVLRDNNV